MTQQPKKIIGAPPKMLGFFTTPPSTSQHGSLPVPSRHAGRGKPIGRRIELPPSLPTALKITARAGSQSTNAAVIGYGLASLLSLGSCFFAATTKLRARLVSQIEINGHRLAYSGTAMEYFRLELFRLALLAVVLSLLILRDNPDMATARMILTVVFCLGALGLPSRIFLGRMDAIAHTTLRGIPFKLDGSPAQFLLLTLGGGALTIATMGLFYPIWRHLFVRFHCEGSSWGQYRLRYKGTAFGMWEVYCRGILHIILSLGIYTPWFLRSIWQYIAAQTVIVDGDGTEVAQFGLEVSGADVLRFIANVLFIRIFTLGIATVWHRPFHMSFLASYVRVKGKLDLDDAVVQQRG